MSALPFTIEQLSVNSSGATLPHLIDQDGRRRRASDAEALMWQRIQDLEKELAETQAKKRK